MKTKKPKTQEQIDRDTSQRLLRTYGIDLWEYNFLLSEQNFVCKICGKPPTNRRLHVDHCHKFVKQKITKRKWNGLWLVEVPGTSIQTVDKNLAVARASVKQKLKANSIRGLLCWPCNRGLQKWRDDPTLMRNAADYLEAHRSKHGFYLLEDA